VPLCDPPDLKRLETVEKTHGREAFAEPQPKAIRLVAAHELQ
jgi:hypothetical protein